MIATSIALVNLCLREEVSTIKTYLAKFTIRDGEHEHHGQFLLKAINSEEAEEIARSQEHEANVPDNQENRTFWDYGDDTTSSELELINEITDEVGELLKRLGVAYYFN